MLPQPKQPKPIVVIYGSGDPGTLELRRQYLNKGHVDFRDIRVNVGTEEKPYLKELHNKRLPTTVPQVFLPDGTYIGDYDAAIAHLGTLPDLQFPGGGKMTA